MLIINFVFFKNELKMPRVYKRKTDRGIKDFDKLEKAIKEIILEGKSIRSTANAYNIPFKSLARYIIKVRNKINDVSTVTENELVHAMRGVASYREHTV